MYLLLLTIPVLALGAVGEVAADAPTATAVYGLGSLVQTALGLAVTSTGLRQALGGARAPRGLLAGLGAVTLALVLVATLEVPATESLPGRSGAIALALGVALVAGAPLMSTPGVTLGSVAVAAAAALERSLSAVPGAVGIGTPVGAFVAVGLLVGGMAATFKLSAWMLGVVWEQERNRTVHARLAVAEERLRFSRDLHDVVGRTFSAIAVKSELAAELARRGQEGAVEQMLEVRELAQDSLRDVRGVVAGYRAADLAAELDGARSVLRSAGVETRVLGDGAALPAPVQEALGWVVREAVTNVVRHADAARCTLDLAVVDATTARLTVRNDGVGRAARGGSGSGLVGLRERLTAVGGELTTAREGATFTLTAVVPLDGRMTAR
ncbi:histidine kinase [Georgenia sp. SUBG003]|uniref:sensor histidine kinase n=1 Tax=Georgenia sp. SUBG003 TaxID=1497974 RepID=UPI0006950DF9